MGGQDGEVSRHSIQHILNGGHSAERHASAFADVQGRLDRQKPSKHKKGWEFHQPVSDETLEHSIELVHQNSEGAEQIVKNQIASGMKTGSFSPAMVARLREAGLIS